ncbi:xylan alpha-1,2-glucuronidase [Bacteroidia bacterium]|nr:xylan alpha-1,2-glucuronidase [Bacteroidia bacterium]
MKRILSIITGLLFLASASLYAEDGSRLWLRAGTGANAQVSSNKKSATIDIALKELNTQWKGGAVKLLASTAKDARGLGSEGFRISGGASEGITITALTDKGLLYGAYHLLRLQETGNAAGALAVEEKPKYERRILNHWDNLNGSIERGYAGHSLWKWEQLPGTLSPKYEAYARANASVGINGTVLNNVNANPQVLTKEYLAKVKALADLFRPYGLAVYLSVNFNSPKALGGLSTADPLDKEVVKWWQAKVKEVYALIPDFGGFLVKANSEGQSGPQDYGRTHVDGANMLADALKPYKGIVMWRAFVYAPSSDDRAKQAYLEFMPFDGKFRDNVIIQIKNGPVDFQPREPFSPLFGALKQTQEMVEFQITQEYLGHSRHLVYLAPLFKETLDSDTYSGGPGSTVAKVTDGTLRPAQTTAIAGVANTGDEANWCGHPFAQSNWYAFGRLAWNYELSSEQIAGEWLKQTFTQDANFVTLVKDLMLTSRETCVNYMMPLCLHHIFAYDHHYGPEPWGDRPGGRADWNPVYYHRADSLGAGFDRTTTGSNAVSQYYSPLSEVYNDINRCPENLLLWFHHVPWGHKMKNGRTMWDNMCYLYDAGVQKVRSYQKVWDRVQPYVDEQRFKEVQERLMIQAKDAVWWKEASLLYFQTFSKAPIPYDIERPVNTLEDVKKMRADLKYF